MLWVASKFTLTLAAGIKLTCAEAGVRLLEGQAPLGGPATRREGLHKGDRWYAWAWIATGSPRHHLLVRRHLKTGELAFHYC